MLLLAFHTYLITGLLQTLGEQCHFPIFYRTPDMFTPDNQVITPAGWLAKAVLAESKPEVVAGNLSILHDSSAVGLTAFTTPL
jgi:hypothetical protein